MELGDGTLPCRQKVIDLAYFYAYADKGILQNLDSGLWTGPWTGLWTGLVTTITNQLACVQATLGAGRA